MASGTSYNGWPAHSDPKAIGVVQSKWFPGGVKAGDVTTVLRYVAEQFNARVEPIVGGWCWGYAYRANVNNPSSLSCHASGTALDINAPEHPNGSGGTFTSAQRGEIYRILDEAQGAVDWLEGYDEMHFEIAVDAATLARIAANLPGTTPTPDEPEPVGAITMFIAIDSVALCALMGNVLLTFRDLNDYGEAKNASPNVPALVIGAKTDMGARQHIYQELIRQHIVAVGEGDALPS